MVDGFELWKKACENGAELLWRVKRNMRLPCNKRLADGSYHSAIYPTTKDRRNQRDGVAVRVIEYSLTRAPDAEGEKIYRLITTLTDHESYPALEMAAIYAHRWEIEIAFDEFKTHLGGRDLVLRSKTPDGVRQEFWGFIMAHHAIRSIMHDAAEKAQIPPNILSYTHALLEIRRKLPQFLIIPPSGLESQV
ncbi:MAG: transposase [Capsulimonadaceae bacterium]|nr:transposase [Capsulimonadaceae bacterium]